MDQLFGIMELEGGELAPPPHHDPDVDSYVKGPLLLGQERTACNVDQSREIVASSGNVLAMVGEITNLADLSSARREDAGTDLEQIARLFAEGGLAGLGELEGLFTIAIFDRASDTLLVLQDRFSSQFTLYWVVRGSKLFFSTRLKKLLMLSGISREVDRSVLPDFMVNGLVPDGRTLMRNVSKLVPGEHLAARRGEGCGVHCGRRPLKDLAIPDIDPDPEHLARTYRRTVSRSLRRLIEPLGRDDLHMILTSGFDSNFSLHLARSLHAGPIHTYCIGTTDRGEFAGESRRAGTIAATYDGVEFHEEVLSGAAVLDLPDIVWRVEGAFCERGLFLRNRLARGVSAGSDHVFGGDLANQVLNPYFLHVPAGWNASNISKRLRLAMHSRRHRARSWNAAWGRRPLAWLYNPRELGLFMNIKQNGSLMSSYSVQLKYPYLDLEFVGLVLSIMRHQRVAALELHRRIIKSSVSPAVREVLGRPKKGPIREALYYQDPSFRRTVAAHVSRSAFLPSIVDRELLDRHLDLFVRSNVDALASVVNRLLFIDLWHRLFLTGDFDDQFSGPSLDSPPRFLVD